MIDWAIVATYVFVAQTAFVCGWCAARVVGRRSEGGTEISQQATAVVAGPGEGSHRARHDAPDLRIPYDWAGGDDLTEASR